MMKDLIISLLSKTPKNIKNARSLFISARIFDLFSNLTHGDMPYMKFLFVRSDVCRQLPSDFTSR